MTKDIDISEECVVRRKDDDTYGPTLNLRVGTPNWHKEATDLTVEEAKALRAELDAFISFRVSKERLLLKEGDTTLLLSADLAKELRGLAREHDIDTFLAKAHKIIAPCALASFGPHLTEFWSNWHAEEP